MESAACPRDTPGAGGLVPEVVPAQTAQSGAGQVQLSLARLNQASPERLDGPDPNESIRPLQRLPPGPWRSLGGYLDYSGWPERERFHELDRAIELQGWQESDRDDDVPRVKYKRGLAALRRPAPMPIGSQKAACTPQTANDTMLPPERR